MTSIQQLDVSHSRFQRFGFGTSISMSLEDSFWSSIDLKVLGANPGVSRSECDALRDHIKKQDTVNS